MPLSNLTRTPGQKYHAAGRAIRCRDKTCSSFRARPAPATGTRFPFATRFALPAAARSRFVENSSAKRNSSGISPSACAAKYFVAATLISNRVEVHQTPNKLQSIGAKLGIGRSFHSLHQLLNPPHAPVEFVIHRSLDSYLIDGDILPPNWFGRKHEIRISKSATRNKSNHPIGFKILEFGI